MQRMSISVWQSVAVFGMVCAALTVADLGQSCQDLMSNPPAPEDEQGQHLSFLCELYESSHMLRQLSDLVTDGVEGLLDDSGVAPDPAMEKRKHEYLRFGKRKHEYLRFGKRKHEYLRFGKRKHEYIRFGKK